MKIARGATATLLASLANPALSELSYSYLDFGGASVTVTATGTQSPVPDQTVTATASDGDGVGVGGSIGIGEHFYVAGGFESSIVNVDSVIESPLATEYVTDNFDLITTTLSFGYRRALGANWGITAEVSYDTADYDFGSVAGENFDMKGDGVGAKLAVRWNPRPRFELFGYARTSSVGQADITDLVFDSAPYIGGGMWWYFFEDLGFGFDYETGEVDTFMISMRFGFGEFTL